MGPFLIPIWIVIASSTISVQGINSRRRTKELVRSNSELETIREKAASIRSSQPSSIQSSTSVASIEDHDEDRCRITVVSKATDGKKGSTTSVVETVADSEPASFSYPHLKTLRPLALAPVQVEISRNLNQLEWRKNIIHIEAMNAHASIVVREKRFSNDGGVAAVQHAVDMFKGDGEDE